MPKENENEKVEGEGEVVFVSDDGKKVVFEITGEDIDTIDRSLEMEDITLLGIKAEKQVDEIMENSFVFSVRPDVKEKEFHYFDEESEEHKIVSSELLTKDELKDISPKITINKL